MYVPNRLPALHVPFREIITIITYIGLNVHLRWTMTANHGTQSTGRLASSTRTESFREDRLWTRWSGTTVTTPSKVSNTIRQ